MEAVGKYRLVRKLAEGGMAEVFLAQVEGPGGFLKPVVVKRVLPELSKDQQFVAMFMSEAKLVAQLNHPNIVQVFDFGFDQGSYFLVMEYVDGCNLRELFKRVIGAHQVVPLELAARMVASACEGLAFAHAFTEGGKALDLIHRDISPENLLVGRNGVVKVADFGIARVAGQKRMTRTGTVRGKLVYMAPEQMQGEPVDCRIDVFALGIVLYELICGRRPFEAKTEVDAMKAILTGTMMPAVTWRADCPPELQRIIDKAMARSRDERFKDCAEMQHALEKFIAGRGVVANAASIGKLVGRFVEAGAPIAPAVPVTVILPPREQRTVPARPVAAPAPRPRSRGGSAYLGAGAGLGLAVAAAAYGLWPAAKPVAAPPPRVVARPTPPPPPPPPPEPQPTPTVAPVFSEEDYPVPPPPGDPPKAAMARPVGKSARPAKVVAPPEPVQSVAKIARADDEPARPAPTPAEPNAPEAAGALALKPARVLAGHLRLDGSRGVVVFNDTDFQWTACEVRMPFQKYFRFGKDETIVPHDSDNIRVPSLENDARPVDEHMKRGYAIVRCREGAAYFWWGTHVPE